MSNCLPRSARCGGEILFMNERDSDVAVFVDHSGNKWRFPAHRLILSSMSEVIRKMLCSEMSEKETKTIVISDSTPLSIMQFLRFVYTGEVRAKEWREMIELLSVAHKYQVDQLIQMCEKHLINNISPPRVCFLYEIGQLYNLEELVEDSSKMILNSAFIVFATDGFVNLSPKSLETFVSDRLLNVEHEIFVLDALKQWGKAECSRKELAITEYNVVNMMKPFIRHVRINHIAASKRTLIPKEYLEDRLPENDLKRVKFFVPPTLHEHMIPLKFVVELGSFVSKSAVTEPMVCVKFSSEVGLYILGFRIVGLFRENFTFGNGNPMLMLNKDERKGSSVQFDLSSVPWKYGAVVGNHVWREIVAYFPHPARIDPFSCYSVKVKYGNLLPTKWPRTRVECNYLNVDTGTAAFYTFGQCAGITELFVLQAPPPVLDCNTL